MWLPLDLYERYSEAEVRKLKGGQKRGRKYFPAVLEGNKIVAVFYALLVNNRQSQRTNPRYPTGYQPFDVLRETWNFDIATSKFEVRRLRVPRYSRPSVLREPESREAVILKAPPEGSELYLLLRKAATRTVREERVRRAAALNLETLTVAGELLQEEVLGRRPEGFGVVTICPAERFEFYLKLAEDQTLRQLLSLLRIDLGKVSPAGGRPVVGCPTAAAQSPATRPLVGGQFA
jgi:hypothetical protein